jgi:thioredoxin reductase
MSNDANQYDVAIIGGGPAGLSAAVVLGRACRRVVIFDHGRPRNYAAREVHGFLGLDGITPSQLRGKGRREAQSYDVDIEDSEVTSVDRLSESAASQTAHRFKISTDHRMISARAVLFATGVVDEVPEISGVRERYGVCVHHCPYCDGWEHRGKRLVALADGSASVELATSLLPWSQHVTCCSNGGRLTSKDRTLLSDNHINEYEEPIVKVASRDDAAMEIQFESGAALACDAIFFGAGQRQHSHFPQSLGCELDENGLIRRDPKQYTCVEGVFVAGDAAGDVQFAIVAAAQGATAAAAINRFLQEQEVVRHDAKNAPTSL